MAIDFTAQTLQVYKVDTSSGKRELKALTDAERSYVDKALAGAESATKARGKMTGATGETTTATRKLYEQMSLLTSSIGGQNSALGKLAFGAKALAGGFGGLGIAMLGAGYAMKALGPVVGAVGDQLASVLGLTDDARWEHLAVRVSRITGLMEEASIQAKIWRLQLEMMSPTDRAAAVSLGKEGDVSRAQESYDAAKQAAARANADLETAQDTLAGMDAWARTAGKAGIAALERENEAAQSLARQAGLMVDLRELEAEKAEIAAFNTGSLADAKDRLAGAETNAATKTRAHTEALVEQTGALEELTRLQQAGWLAKQWGGGPRPTTDADLMATIEKEGLSGGGPDIDGLGLGKGSGPAELVDRTAGALKRLEQSRVFSTVRDSAVEMWAAIATGAMRAADAAEQAIGQILFAGGNFLAGEAIKQGVLILTDWAKAAAHAAAAAKAALGATALYAMAGAMGSGGGGGGSGTGGFSAGGGSAPVDRTEVHNYFIGESFTGQSPRQLYSHQQQISSVGSRRTS